MNTVKKGDDFEVKSLEILKNALENGSLGFMKEYVKIRVKHNYFSDIRNDHIQVDLAIEIWPPGAEKYAFLCLVECKNYKTRIPATKLEAFHSHIIQLNAHKGIFISNSPLQKGGFNVANKLGIMFIQGESVDNYKIILHKVNKASLPSLKKDIFDEGTNLLIQKIDAEILIAFEQIDNKEQVSYNIQHLKSEEIESICNSILDDINDRIRSKGKVLNESDLVNFMKIKFDLDVIEYSQDESLLGYCDIENNQIGLNSSLKEKNRKLFVLAHEFGHYILHSKLKIGQKEYDRFYESEYCFKRDKHDLNNPKHWIEWQANHFAECLILNNNSFMFQLNLYLKRNGIPIRKIYVDDQPANQKRFQDLVSNLSYLFSVSKTSIIYKLKSIDMLEDKSRIQPIGKIINEMYI